MQSKTLAATRFSLVELAEILNQAYAGYVVPVAFDAAALARRIIGEHIDLGASHVLLVEDQPAGIMLVARRGARARIAALGLATPRRGQGLGRQAIALAQAEAEARGDSALTLEVITSNAAAQRTYLASGFVTTRQLVGYECRVDGLSASLPAEYQLCEVAELLPLLSQALPSDLPWQLAPQSLAGLQSPSRGLRRRDGRAAALFDSSGRAPRLISLATAPDARGAGLATELLDALFATIPGHWQVPAMVPEDLIEGFLTRRGWQRGALAQYEMLWRPAL